MDTSYQTEIVELHRFFQNWFNGDIPCTDEAFQRMDRVMDDGFTIVMPNGKRIDRDPLLTGLYKAHGGRPGIRIWIEHVRLLMTEGPMAVVEYEEWQQEGETTTARVSTAVFRDEPAAPNGLSWLRVHETWFEPQNKNWFDRQPSEENDGK